MANVPEDVAVIIPVRFPKSSINRDNLLMKNDFSVTILDVPINNKRNLCEIKLRCDKLRKSADPLVIILLILLHSIINAIVLVDVSYSLQ